MREGVSETGALPSLVRRLESIHRDATQAAGGERHVIGSSCDNAVAVEVRRRRRRRRRRGEEEEKEMGRKIGANKANGRTKFSKLKSARNGAIRLQMCITVRCGALKDEELPCVRDN